MTSVTMQYIHYIQQEYPQHEFELFCISSTLKKIEKEEAAFQEILDSVQSSDGVLWASPVYFMLIPANYKRFIELITERGVRHLFRNKHTAFLSTSIHFFDHATHNYMQAVCDDMGMRFVGSFSADKHDLKKEEERKRLTLFAENLFEAIESDAPLAKSYLPLVQRDFEYLPVAAESKIDTGGKKILILTDSTDGETNLARMVDRFSASFSDKVEVVNLWDLEIKGSCQACLQCCYDNHCMYEGKDEFNNFYNTKLRDADILVWAGSIQDRFLSARWKMFFDRSFFSGHTPTLQEKQFAFIISGPVGQLPHLRQFLEGFVELQYANLVDFISDEDGNSEEISRLIQHLANQLVRFADKKYVKPATFLGTGGAKIFRDEVYGRLRFPFRADHVAFKRLGLYDFPQKKYKIRILNAIMLFLTKSPRFRKRVNKRIKKEIIRPLQKVLNQKIS